jgi:hypothetical protein
VTTHVPTAFDGFWKRYPRKVGKADAARAFTRALRRVESPDVILKALDRLIPAWARGDPKFIPHPSTWLNRDGWDDDPPPSDLPKDRNIEALKGAFEDVIERTNDDPRGSWRTDRPDDVDLAEPGMDQRASINVASRPATP